MSLDDNLMRDDGVNLMLKNETIWFTIIHTANKKDIYKFVRKSDSSKN